MDTYTTLDTCAVLKPIKLIFFRYILMFTGPLPWTIFNSGTYKGSIGASPISGIPLKNILFWICYFVVIFIILLKIVPFPLCLMYWLITVLRHFTSPATHLCLLAAVNEEILQLRLQFGISSIIKTQEFPSFFFKQELCLETCFCIYQFKNNNLHES